MMRMRSGNRIREGRLDSWNHNTTSAAQMTVGMQAQGSVQSTSDRDWVRLTRRAGTNYQFNLRGAGSGGGSLSNPFLEMRNTAGTLMAFDDNSGTGVDSRINFSATRTQTVFLSARGVGGARGTYLLTTTTV